MKKLLNILLVLTLCLGLAACGSNDSDSDSKNDTQISDTEVKDDETIDETINDTQEDQENTETFDEGFDQFLGVWYSWKSTQDKQIEIYEDGRIVLNGSAEYTVKDYDGERFKVYIGDKCWGTGYIDGHLSEPDMPVLIFEPSADDDPILGVYRRIPE